MILKELLNSILLNGPIDTAKLVELVPEIKQMADCPQNHPAHCYNLLEHTIKVVEQVPAVLPLKLVALFHDTGKLHTRKTGDDGVDHFWGHEEISCKIAAERLKELGYEERLVELVCILILKHDLQIRPDRECVTQQVKVLGKQVFEMLMALQRSDLMAHSEWYIKKKLPRLEQIARIYYEDVSAQFI